MNILQCLLMLSALASLLVTGSNMVPVQSYASAAGGGNNGDYKITKDYKDSIHKDVDSKSDSTNQHSSQGNLCYKDDGCEQADEGQQVDGKDNTASGFNDQSKNIEQQQAALSLAPTTGTPGNGTTLTTSTLTVTKHVECNFTSSEVECPTADEFNITATTGNVSSLSFGGSESGTPLRINPPFPVIYQVTESNALPGFDVATIPVGSIPIGVAFNPDNGFVYVANFNSNTVSVIDPSTNTVVATIPVGTNPVGIAFNPNNGDLYVTNADDNNVSVIDGTTNTVTATIPVGNGPFDVAFNPNNGDLYVTNADDNNVSVIDGATNTVVTTIPLPVGSIPIGVAFNPDNGFVYVANFNSNTVSVIDPSTNTVVATIPVGTNPVGIAFNPDNGFMYVTNINSNTVSVIAPLTTTFSEGCNGTIDSTGQAATCTVTNAYGMPA